MGQEILSPKQLANHFGVSTDTVRKWCKYNVFPTYDINDGATLTAERHPFSGHWVIYVRRSNAQSKEVKNGQ